MPSSSSSARGLGQAGALAALVVLFLDLLWRATAGASGAPSLPETVVAAVARLTPVPLFGWATETFGSLAQNTLFAAVLVGFVLAGYWAGCLVDTLGSMRGGATSRFGLALSVAGLLFLVLTAGVFPLAREGMFAVASQHQVALLAQAALFCLGWALTLTAATRDTAVVAPVASPGEADLSRRTALHKLAAAGLAIGVAGLGWRLARAPQAGNSDAQRQAAADIAARARAGSPAVPEPELAAPEATPAPVLADATSNDEAIFDTLEAEGRLTPVITPVADFYHVSKNIADPQVDVANWSLSIGGLIKSPRSYTLDELVGRATTHNITTLSCISNELNGDLAGTAEWTGIPLRELLEEVGVNPATVDLVFRAADGYDDSIPFATAMSPSTLLVTGMNGEPLPPDHGAPARLIVPPIYGMKNVKWIEQIEAVDHDYQGFWQTRGWSDPAPYQIWGRIDTPRPGEEVAGGEVLVAGVAAAGNRGILRVELSADGGETWGDAELEPSINPNFTWVRWVYPMPATGGDVTVMMRATDGNGTVAPMERRPPLPDGATGWPERMFRVA
ncbi:MAG: molybdopterin-dependent oxidoreductase [Thermomicrobiales bacterium]|nr:molybdopterin-dependent oxidoreductase [Thermomicrobiales bacterium]